MPPSIYYDPLDPATIENPYPVYAAMRMYSPVHWHEQMHSWVLTRYRDCRDVLRDSELFARDPRRIGKYVSGDRLSIQMQDPPDQAELRRLIIDSMRAQDLKHICERARWDFQSLIAGRAAGDAFDFVSEVAAPVALQVTCELVGVDGLELATYHRIFEGLTRRMDWSLDSSRIEGGDHAGTLLATLMRSWFNDKLGRGMIGHIQSSLVGNPMPDPYVQNTMSAVFNACYSTLYASTGSVVLLLIQRPEILAALSNRRLIETAVDELIRFVSPAQGTNRYATRPTMVGGTHIDENDIVVTLFAAANRDPEQFPEPDELTLDRLPNPHLGFGWGPHVCAGAQVATTWLCELVQFLHEQPPKYLQLVGAPTYMHTATLRSLSYFPVVHHD